MRNFVYNSKEHFDCDMRYDIMLVSIYIISCLLRDVEVRRSYIKQYEIVVGENGRFETVGFHRFSIFRFAPFLPKVFCDIMTV